MLNQSKQFSVIGFDVGTKRIGMAIGQTISHTASPLEIIRVKNNKPDWHRIETLINSWRPELLIVGMPHTMQGERQAMTKHAEQFQSELEQRFDIPVESIDELLSSHEAKNRLRSTRNLDAVAAQAIVETWLYQVHSDPNHLCIET